jgi:integrase
MPRARSEIPWLAERQGTYYAFWYNGEKQRTERTSLYTKDAREAQHRFAAFLIQGAPIYDERQSDGHNLTVTEALDLYYKEHVAQKCVARSRQEYAIGHLKAFFGAASVASVDIPAARKYAAHRRKCPNRMKGPDGVGISDATIRRELNVLRAAAEHCRKWKRLTANDMPEVELPTLEPKEASWLTKEELARVFEAAKGRTRDFAMVTYYTGSRRHAVEALRKSQINLEAGTINLHQPGAKVTKKRKPIVPIFDEIKDIVARLMETSETEFLFGSVSDMYTPFREACEAAGLPHKRHPHILRHSRATHLLQDGKDIYAVAKLLGDTVATVERVYGHQSPYFLAHKLQ